MGRSCGNRHCMLCQADKSRGWLAKQEAKLRDEFRGRTFEVPGVWRSLYDEVDLAAWQRTWIIDCEAVGDGRSTLKYLAAYVCRAAVTERRIPHCDWHEDMDVATVRLQVKRSGTHKYRGMPLTVAEIIRRYLQHVLRAAFRSYVTSDFCTQVTPFRGW